MIPKFRNNVTKLHGKYKSIVKTISEKKSCVFLKSF